MASRTSLTELEFIQHIQDWQARLGNIANSLAQLHGSNLAKLQRGGLTGLNAGSYDINNINGDILLRSAILQNDIQLLLSDILTLFNVTAASAISSGDPLDFDSLTMDTDIAKFFGVSDASDIPYAWWIHDNGATGGKYLLATEVNPDRDMVQALELDPNDIILVQDSNAETDTDKPAGIQKGRRLKVTLTDDNLTHDGETYYGEIQLDTDSNNPYALRDLGALAAWANVRVKDTRLILRRVFDETV